MKLNELQSAFKHYLFSGANEATLAAAIRSTPAGAAAPRLDVYRNAYYIRLQEALARNFPVLLGVLGEQAFGRTMAAYLQADPSRHFSLQSLGAQLTAWLHRQQDAELADLAMLEWAVLRAFDAAAAECLSADTLAGIAAGAWQELRLKPVPSLSLLVLSSNAAEVWSAHVRQQTVPPLQVTAPQPVVVWRADNGPALHRINDRQYQFLQSLAVTTRLGEACDRLDRLSPWLDITAISAEVLLMACRYGWLTRLTGDD
jgi:hypothetical protein